jgi:ABC-2 type transport system ATP-binding protein
MITVENLTKKFDEVTAVEGLTFQVEEGEVFGYLGPNGAGKTTTIRMLCCLISKTSGEAKIDDYQIGKEADSLKIRKMIGLVPDNVGLYEDLTAFENLDFYGKLYECPEGRRRKNIERFLKMPGLWKQGRTIFLNTHNLDEAQTLCDRIGILKTKLLRVGSPQQLRESLTKPKTEIRLAQVSDALVSELRKRIPNKIEVSGDKLIIGVTDPDKENPVIIAAITTIGGQVREVNQLVPTLEDAYLQIVKEAK